MLHNNPFNMLKSVLNLKLVLCLISALSMLSKYIHTEETKEIAHKHQDIVLTSKVLHLIDGIPGAMDAYRMRQIMNTGRLIVKLQFGVPKSKNSSQRIGTVNYKGRWYTLKEIVTLEEQYIKNKKLKKPLDDPEIKDLYTIATKQFRHIVTPYLEEVKKFKPITLKLIEEFCSKAKKPHSYLRRWKEGDDEEKIFYQHIKSNKDLFVFCTDLTHFLSSMVASCPKGYKKYLDWKKKIQGQKPKHNKIVQALKERLLK